MPSELGQFGYDWSDLIASPERCTQTQHLKIGNSSFTTLFVNVGSTKAEACVVKYSPVKIAMNTATHIEVIFI